MPGGENNVSKQTCSPTRSERAHMTSKNQSHPGADSASVSQRGGPLTRALPRALSLVLNNADATTWLWLVVIVLQGLAPAALIVLIRPLIDALTPLIGSGLDWEQAKAPAALAGLIGALLLATQLLTTLSTWLRTLQAERLRDRILARIHRQAIALDLGYFDSAEHHDELHRALGQSQHTPVALLESLGTVLQGGITLGAVAGILAAYGTWLPLALLASAAPTIWVLMRHNQRYHRWWMSRTESDRRAWYLSRILTTREPAAELRLFDLGQRLLGKHEALRKSMRRERIGLATERAFAETAATLSGLGVSAAVLVWVGIGVLRGSATLGDLALFQQAFQRGQGIMRGFLSSAGQVYGNALYLEQLTHYLTLKPKLTDPTNPQPAPSVPTHGFQLQAVRFAYPGGATPVLDGLDLQIHAGRITALLGTNGAGKSTLVKLLTRLYDPQQGRILIDGVDLRDMSRHDLRQRIGPLFQEPLHYNGTVSEGIGLGDTEPGDPTRIRQAARMATADRLVQDLPAGYDTMLGKAFSDGVEPSGGQWQRLALARALLRDAPILLLDEPTSAMDPWSEREWLETLRTNLRGKLVLLITHRVAAAAQADEILVLQRGRVVERGTHSDLISRNGPYAQSWQRASVHKSTATVTTPVDDL